MRHQQLVSNTSYCREHDMTAQDVASIMESVHIVHQRRIEEAADKQEIPIRSAFSRSAIEYYC